MPLAIIGLVCPEARVKLKTLIFGLKPISPVTVCNRLVCDKLVCNKLVCDKLVCNKLVCNKLVCDRLVCNRLVCNKVVQQVGVRQFGLPVPRAKQFKSRDEHNPCKVSRGARNGFLIQ
jgi:hypothetical protein